MPIINIKNKQELNEITKSNFLKGTIISFDFNLDYKVCFFKPCFFPKYLEAADKLNPASIKL